MTAWNDQQWKVVRTAILGTAICIAAAIHGGRYTAVNESGNGIYVLDRTNGQVRLCQWANRDGRGWAACYRVKDIGDAPPP